MHELADGKSLGDTAAKYGIDFQTLYKRFKGQHSKPRCILPANDEELLVQSLVSMSEIGIPLTRSLTLGIVNNYIKKNHAAL